MLIRWNEIDRGEWERRLAAGAPGGVAALQQDWCYGEAARRIGGETLRAAVEIDGRPAALAQFGLRRIGWGRRVFATWALCARGPVWLNEPDEAAKAEIFRALKRTAPIGRRRVLFFSPDEAAPSQGLIQAGLRRVMTGYSTAVVDLETDLETLRGRMQGKWRNRLVAAERAPLTIASGRPKPGRYDWLLRKDAEQQRRNRYEALPAAFTPAYQSAAERKAGKRGLRLLRAELDGRCVAAMLFLIHGRAATYHIGWSDEAGRRLSAHNALLWRAVAELKAAGLSRLDLGGVDTESGAGIARFKLGSGARPLTLCGTYL